MRQKIITDVRKLRQKSDIIQLNEAKSIIKDLEDSLDLAKGIGLSAVQIGILKAVSIIRFGNVKIDLINPKILTRENKIRMQQEGCLSLPGIRIDTLRYVDIVLENNGHKYYSTGTEAICIQHEIDHINGLTILDRKWRKR